jgi:hypothetical protein
MGTIKTYSAVRAMNGKVEVKLDVQTSAGRPIVPLVFDDQGNQTATRSKRDLSFEHGFKRPYKLWTLRIICNGRDAGELAN